MSTSKLLNFSTSTRFLLRVEKLRVEKLSRSAGMR